MFTDRSRYKSSATRERTLSDGRTVVYVLPRMVPPPEARGVAARIIGTDSDRIDSLAWRNLGATEAWWMITDANRAMHPAEVLVEPGEEVNIPLTGPETGPLTGQG